MTFNLNRRTFMLSSATTLALGPNLALAAADAHVVEMLNKDPDNPKLRSVFSPRLISIDAGQSVLFKATDRGHNSEAAKGMIPEGVEPWKGKIGKDIEIRFDVPGFYGYVCTPHASQGMVGMVIVKGVGLLNNLETARAVKHRGKAKAVFDEIWIEAESQGLLV